MEFQLLDAYIQAAMCRDGICGLHILKWLERRAVIENMYFTFHEPSDAVTMTFDAASKTRIDFSRS